MIVPSLAERVESIKIDIVLREMIKMRIVWVDEDGRYHLYADEGWEEGMIE